MKIAICTPIHDKVAAHTHISIAALMYHLGKQGHEVKFDPPIQQSNLANARNFLLQESYDWGADVAMWIDDDMDFRPEDVFKLVGYVTAKAYPEDVDIASGVYRYKSEKIIHAGAPTEDGAKFGDFIEMDFVGTGFVAMSRRAMKKLIDATPLYWSEHTGTEYHAVFEFKKGKTVEKAHGTEAEVVLFHGEDRVFSDLWRSLGGKLWLATDVHVGHVGYKVYR